MYAATGSPGILKSSDGGSTWAAANSGLFAVGINTLAIDPQNPRTLYAGVSGAGLLKSTDGGAELEHNAVQVLHDVDVRPAGTRARCTRLGQRASMTDKPGCRCSLGPVGYTGPIVIDKQNPDTIYSGTGKSSDAGASWVQLAEYVLATDPQIVGTIYAWSEAGAGGNGVPEAVSVSSGVLKSVDGGRTWTGVNTLWHAVDVSSVTVDPTNSSVVYAQTTNLDCSWVDCSGGDYNTELLKFLGQFKSTDGGTTWVKLDGVSLLGFGPTGHDLCEHLSRGIARSQDHGATWNPLPTAGLIAGIGVLAIDPQNPNHLFTGTSAGVFEITLAPGNE